MKRHKARASGQARQSQLLTTFGPGSMIDLPHRSGVVSGLDAWQGAEQHPIHEDRLVAKVEDALGRRPLRLMAPPVESVGERSTGVSVHVFPLWFVVPECEVPQGDLTARPLVPFEMLTSRRRYLAEDKKNYSVVPVRFVQACERGHLSDIDWRGFVHSWEGKCQKPLWIEERGTSGDFFDVFIRCECGTRRSLDKMLSTHERPTPLGYCQGYRPWLGPFAAEKCGHVEGQALPNRLLIRSASHAYFAQTLSVIHIPEHDKRLKEAIESVWENHLLYIKSPERLREERERPNVAQALAGFTDEAVWAAIEQKKSGRPPDPKKIKPAEMETLLASDVESVGDVPRGDYHARTLRFQRPASGPMSAVDRIVLVHRLREVRALIGFSRFHSHALDIHGEATDVVRAEISRDVDWVPAVDNRGEGFFIGFREEELAEWETRPAVIERVRQLEVGFERGGHPGEDFPGGRYILLHSLSHLLITAVALECGYAAAAIRERVYVTDEGCGILLYTASAGSEGTLGGLIEVGRALERHLSAALEQGRLCAGDPVCAEHTPDHTYEERFSHGAACHGCLLIAEPSCERFNAFLDRALVVPTVRDADCAFFRDAP